jgi:hypothetical protein
MQLKKRSIMAWHNSVAACLWIFGTLKNSAAVALARRTALLGSEK